ncbi:membrane protein [Microbacterium phage YuuY]|nr:membrane protein [Microbacterium phage YuuY]
MDAQVIPEPKATLLQKLLGVLIWMPILMVIFMVVWMLCAGYWWGRYWDEVLMGISGLIQISGL